MYGVLPHYTVVLILFVDIFSISSAIENNQQISIFEYGVHVEGEEASFAAVDLVPSFVPHYTLNITPTNPDLEQRYTYLRVEYVSPMSTVDINFKPDTFNLSFYIRFPFMSIPYGVVGYSLKRPRSKLWSTWRKSLRKSRGIQNMCLKGHP